MHRKDRLKTRELSESQRLKSPTSAATEEIDYPVFCFRHIADGYKVNDCNDQQANSLLQKLAKMAQQSWQELMTGSHWSGAGFEQMPRDQITAPLPAIVTEDVSKLLVMRFGGTDHRLIGLRSSQIFHITHIDTSLTAYKH